MWTLGGKKNHVLPGSPDPPPWNGDKTWACPDMPAVYIVYLISKDSSDAAFGYRYLLHSTTRCKARLGCSPPRLLIIVDSSVNWFACVQRECQINVWGRKVRFHGGGNVRSRCTGVVNRNRRGRPRVLHLRRSSPSWLTTQILWYIGHCGENNMWIE